MISVVCVYNNEIIFAEVLLKSLQKQTAAYELIALDNTSGRFRSAAEAYNFGGASAEGDYIMFAHQDMWLTTGTWLEHAERTLRHLPALGVAGVAGVAGALSMSQRSERAHFASSCFFLDETTVVVDEACLVPQEVDTLDECILLVPRPVFDKLKFDETTFDGWDCYGADYCLTVKNLGFKAYVIPVPCSHCCTRSTSRRWEFKSLVRYQKRLYSKHRHNYNTIYTWMGEVNRWNLLIWSLKKYLGPLSYRLLPSSDTFVRRQLAGCETVLDLGCGYCSFVGRLKFRFSLGLDPVKPYLMESKRRFSHNEYLLADIRSIPLKPKSFDAVIALHTLECLTKEEGTALLYKMEELAKKRVIAITPNRYLEHQSNAGNTVKEHREGWEVADLVKLGFRIRGDGGRKKSGGGKFILNYQPAILRLLTTILDQLVIYHYPKSANILMAVKHVDSNSR